MQRQQFLTAEEVAENLRVNIMTVYRYIKAGKINASKIGKEFRISENELNNFLQRTSTKTR